MMLLNYHLWIPLGFLSLFFLFFIEAYNMGPCKKMESAIADTLGKINRFNPERDVALKKLDYALTQSGFKETQIHMQRRYREELIEIRDKENSWPEHEKVGKNGEKICKYILDTYVHNCAIELRVMFQRKSTAEVKLALERLLKKKKYSIEALWKEYVDTKAREALKRDQERYIKTTNNQESNQDINKENSSENQNDNYPYGYDPWKSPETLKDHLVLTAQKRNYTGVCDIFADFWYNEKSSIYKTDEDLDEVEAYYPYPVLPLSKPELQKLSNAQLRQIAADRNQKCKGCRTKADFVEFAYQIQSSSPTKNLDKISKNKTEDL